MKIFIDTANIEEIAEFVDLGIIDGVTTNPSLIAQSGLLRENIIPKIVELVKGPISVEVVGSSAYEIFKEAIVLSKIADNVVIKVPCTLEGLKAVKKLSTQGIKTNVTLVFSLSQALLAAKAGATYISPFVGRLDDIGENGVQLVENIVKMLYINKFDTKVIAASIRSVEHIEKLMLTGCDIATVPAKVLNKLIKHPLTDKGIEQFILDYKNSLNRN